MRILTCAVAVLMLAAPARAQQVKLEIQNGLVNLEATSVPVRVILAEWAKVGGTRVVGADKITGAPLTLQLVNTPERKALDIILRNVAGYMAAPRLASAAPGASTYDRILILPTSSPPAAAANATPRPGGPVVPGQMPGQMGGIERRVPPRPPSMAPPRPVDVNEDEQEVDEDEADIGVAQQPVFTFPQPQQQPGTVFVPAPNVGRPGQVGAPPAITLQPNANGQPTIYNFVPTAPGTGSPGAFTVIGSPQPGMIQQPPAQPTPGPPGTPRPPGD